jgi:hypothetical protein
MFIHGNWMVIHFHPRSTNLRGLKRPCLAGGSESTIGCLQLADVGQVCSDLEAEKWGILLGSSSTNKDVETMRKPTGLGTKPV